MDSRHALYMALWLAAIAVWIAALLILGGCVNVNVTQNGDYDQSTVSITSMPMGTATIPVQLGPKGLPGIPGA